jgi:hypothetical protein
MVKCASAEPLIHAKDPRSPHGHLPRGRGEPSEQAAAIHSIAQPAVSSGAYALINYICRCFSNEAELLELSLRRQDAASSLGLDLTNPPAPLAQDSDVERLRRRARSASRSWALGGWRRRPLADLLGLTGAERTTCSMAAEFLESKRDGDGSVQVPTADVTLANELRTCRAKVRDASRARVIAVVAAKVHHAKGGIARRLQALQGSGSRHDAIKKMRAHPRAARR